ncbi:iron ABC transporter permease [Pseudomonas sp. 7P_10.2_Bac1]|uniref:FecCD family ABC transporter permease n=1 Tax=Pseudomonas sp. 7P_10.2_Bac1 TaxID=2971614 RepID=UPI0021C9FBD1|nr:iron ABC transporter permease [Pseudomonas sp. 7P_10.2_Bac1]MCU1726684.1 iron ABC transporter permease [Pseudomonas sp. 7P_10.2_Bac1]
MSLQNCARGDARQRKRYRGLIGGVALLLLMSVLSLTLGSRSIDLAHVLDALRHYDRHNDLHLIVREMRVPRTLVAVLAGLALGVAGAIMQAVTRNPLAEPGLLGINAGAALAVIIGAVAFHMVTPLAYIWLAFIGAGLAGIAVFIIGQAHSSANDPVRLVLAGAGLSIMLTSITGIFILNAPIEVFDQFRHWASGSLERSGLEAAAVLAVAVSFGCVVAMLIVSNLNILALGKDLGLALGANPRSTWLLACLAVMLLAGSATAGAGPIAFVGLVAPHISRLLVGPDYRWILPYSGLYAAILLLGADVLGRVVVAPSEIAAGIIALLLGGPFFIAVVRKYRLSQL